MPLYIIVHAVFHFAMLRVENLFLFSHPEKTIETFGAKHLGISAASHDGLRKSACYLPDVVEFLPTKGPLYPGV